MQGPGVGVQTLLRSWEDHECQGAQDMGETGNLFQMGRLGKLNQNACGLLLHRPEYTKKQNGGGGD